jgi:hypothetical protein
LSSLSSPPRPKGLTCSKMNFPGISLIVQTMHFPCSRSHIESLRRPDKEPRRVVATSSVNSAYPSHSMMLSPEHP